MALTPCLRCGTLHRNGTYCQACAPRGRESRSPTTRAQRGPGEWRTQRAAALQRDEHRCVRCGETNQVEVHHIIPVAAGGTHHLDNLTTLCPRHHRHEHHRAVTPTAARAGLMQTRPRLA